MRSVVDIEGLCTVEIPNVSELLAYNSANTEFIRAESYDKVYYAITYGPFFMGEYKYEIRVFPCNGNLDCFISFLEYAGEIKKITSMVLVNPENDIIKPSITVDPSSPASDFMKVTLSRRPARLVYSIGSSDISRCTDGYLLAKFVFWIQVGPPKPTPCTQPDQKLDQPNCSMPDVISTLLAGGFADITFIIKGETFAAHRAILAARSSVFRSELLALQDERFGNKLHVSIKRIDAITFKNMLHFIYTNSLPSDFEDTRRRYNLMFVAAYRFNIEGLKLICEEKLTKTVVDSIVTTLEINECSEELSLLKIVPKDCHMKPKTTTDEE